MLSALALCGCGAEGAECRDPQSLNLRVVHRESTCIPDMDVSPDALGCEQLAGRVDDDLCEFTGEAVCTDGVRASVWYTLGKPARGHATHHRPEDGSRVVLDLGERE